MSRPFLAPIATGTVNDAPVRFYRSPRQGPDLAWHSIDDLFMAAGLPRQERRQLVQRARVCFPSEVHTIGTTDGVVTIVPDHAARGFIAAVVEAGGPPEFHDDYGRAAAQAAKILTAHLSPLAAAEWIVAAVKREGELN